MRAVLERGRKFLRSGKIIVGEVAALILAAVVSTLLPQEPDLMAVQRFLEAWPATGRITAGIGLHSVVTTPWFLALSSAALASLLVVQWDQWHRVLRQRREAPGPEAFARAAFRAELPLAAARRVPEAPRIRRSGVLGAYGSPVFHLGLVVVVLAGVLRLLFFREAVVLATEGQVLEAGHPTVDRERGGWISSPLLLPAAVELGEFLPSHYRSGVLEQLLVRGVVAWPGRSEPFEARINHPHFIGPVELYLGQDFGVRAVLHLEGAGEPTQLDAFLKGELEVYRGKLALPGGGEARLTAHTGGGRAGTVEVRLWRDGVLGSVAQLAPGQAVPVAGGALRLVAAPWFCEIHLARDLSRPLFFTGVVVAILGVILMFSVIRVDEAVFVKGDRLVIALQPQRLAPLFQERFDALRREWEA